MIKILLVDDEVFSRDMMAKIIRRKNFEVIVASTGEECINLYKEQKPQVVFLDVMLPDLDGDHVHSYLKEINKDVIIYYITGSETVFTPENAKTLGAKGYLKKPVEIKDLFNVLDEIKQSFGDNI